MLEALFCILTLLGFIVIWAIDIVPVWQADAAAMSQPPMVGVVEEVTISSRKSCTDIYLQIDGDVYYLDVDDIPVPAEGSEVLYRAADERIVDIEKVADSPSEDESVDAGGAE